MDGGLINHRVFPTGSIRFLTDKFLYFRLVLLTLNFLLKFNFGSKKLLALGT